MNIQSSLLLASLVLLSVPARAQTLLRKVNGSASERYGTAVIRAGDQNNDGFADLLVGAPGSNSGKGAIYCVSGAFLALGSGSVHVWSLTTTTSSAGMGRSLAQVGDVVGNAAPDFVVGAVGISGIFVVDGTTRAVVATLTGGTFAGISVAALGDLDGDGKSEVAVGASGGTGTVFVVRGSQLSTSGSLATKSLNTITGSVFGFGISVAGGFDYDGDGLSEVAVGSLFNTQQGGPTEAGAVIVRNASPTAPPFFRVYVGGTAGEHLGASIDAADDYNGDGKVDLIVGAPDFTTVPGGTPLGRVVVLSGAKLVANLAPELHLLPGGSTTVGVTPIGWRFGTGVRATPDLNNDGVGDIVVGLPSFTTGVGGTRGGARVFSGKTGARLVGVNGTADEALGDAVLGAIADLDADGFAEWVVAGSNGDSPTTDCGSIKCYRLFPVTGGFTYCTAKPNSLGCTPFVSVTGMASISSASPFMVDCNNLVNKKSGVLLYSQMPGATAFQGGFLCVKAPIKRLGPVSSGGSTTGNDCTGVFTFDFNAHIQSGKDPAIVVGSQVFCQYWSRDPQSPSGTNLSNAASFMVNP